MSQFSVERTRYPLLAASCVISPEQLPSLPRVPHSVAVHARVTWMYTGAALLCALAHPLPISAESLCQCLQNRALGPRGAGAPGMVTPAAPSAAGPAAPTCVSCRSAETKNLNDFALT